MPTVVISEFMDPAAVDDLRRSFEVLYDPGLVDARADLVAHLDECRALIVRNRTQVDSALIASAPRLEVVGRLGVGLDNIDLTACAERGIAVCPATGANNLSVAEYVITGLLMLLRGAYRATDRVLAGEWPRNALMGREVCGKQLGLIGFGAIARDVADRARAMGMTVIAFDPYVPSDDAAWRAHSVAPLPLDALLARADAISLHVPLTEDTRHLIDAEALDAMSDRAVLINAARGGVVDETALAEALKGGRLAGAMLDVFESEPLADAGHFEDVPNLVLTPHIAGVTDESNVRVSALTAENVRRALMQS